MTKFIKPVFTTEELDSKKTGLYIGYDSGDLISGYDFSEKPKTLFQKKVIALKEQINGIAKARLNHAKIGEFGYAVFYPERNEIWFGVKYSCPNGLNTLARSTIQKYNQLLEYYLNDSGWKNIEQDDFSCNFVVKLNHLGNIQRLYTLSPSIRFYYKSERPNAGYFECIKAEFDKAQNKQQFLDNEKKYAR